MCHGSQWIIIYTRLLVIDTDATILFFSRPRPKIPMPSVGANTNRTAFYSETLLSLLTVTASRWQCLASTSIFGKIYIFSRLVYMTCTEAVKINVDNRASPQLLPKTRCGRYTDAATNPSARPAGRLCDDCPSAHPSLPPLSVRATT